MNWDSSWNKKFHKALLEAFTLSSLKQMVNFGLRKSLPKIVNTNASLTDIVFELIELAEREEWVFDLLESARKANPDNKDLRDFAEIVESAVHSTPEAARSTPERPTIDDEQDSDSWYQNLSKIGNNKWVRGVIGVLTVVGLVVGIWDNSGLKDWWEARTENIALTTSANEAATSITTLPPSPTTTPTSISVLNATLPPSPTLTLTKLFPPTSTPVIVDTVEPEETKESAIFRLEQAKESDDALATIRESKYLVVCTRSNTKRFASYENGRLAGFDIAVANLFAEAWLGDEFNTYTFWLDDKQEWLLDEGSKWENFQEPDGTNHVYKGLEHLGDGLDDIVEDLSMQDVSRQDEGYITEFMRAYKDSSSEPNYAQTINFLNVLFNSESYVQELISGMVNSISKEDKPALIFVSVPSDKRVECIEHGWGDVLMAAFGKTDNRCIKIRCIEPRYAEDGLKLAVRTDSEIEGICDLHRGSTEAPEPGHMGVVTGTTPIEHLGSKPWKGICEDTFPDPDIIPYASRKAAFDAVVNEEIDAYTTDGVILKGFVNTEDYQDTLKIVGGIYFPETFHYGIPLIRVAGFEQLIKNTYENIVEGGDYAEAHVFAFECDPAPLLSYGNVSAQLSATECTDVLSDSISDDQGKAIIYRVQELDHIISLSQQVYGSHTFKECIVEDTRNHEHHKKLKEYPHWLSAGFDLYIPITAECQQRLEDKQSTASGD
ncbi:MAG: effector-associated domain EAD1-containing protein [Candidatus Promineifilaceae bacterium]